MNPIGKEWSMQPGHSDTIRHREDNCQGRTADRKTGGPRYPLVARMPITSDNQHLRLLSRQALVVFFHPKSTGPKEPTTLSNQAFTARGCPESKSRRPQGPALQAHGDEEIAVGKEWSMQPGHSDTVRHREDNCQGRTADRRTGGPRYPLRA